MCPDPDIEPPAISDAQLLYLNRLGFFPSIQDSEASFLERVENILKLSKQQALLFSDPLTGEDWQGANQITQSLFDMSVDWVAGHYSNQRLPFWQGAATWICEMKDHFELPLIQLKTKFKKKKLFGLYQVDEVLAHESVHASRMSYNEPKFEEMLAFCTSRKAYRRWLGPLFRSSKESYFLIGLMLLSLLSQTIFYLCIDHWVLNFLVYLPWAVVLFGILRLFRAHAIFASCKNNMRSVIKDPKRPLPVLLRLTDREIELFAKMTSSEILQYVGRRSSESLRWRLIQLAYF